MSRERTTWNRNVIAARVKNAEDPRAMNQDHLQQQPAADEYVTGDPSTFAEDVHPSGKNWKAEYGAGGTTERNEIGEPEMRDDTFNHPEKAPGSSPARGGGKSASLSEETVIKKADLCVKVARTMLGNVSDQAIEDQAFALMDLPDAALIQTVNRIEAAQEKQENDDDDDGDKKSNQQQDKKEAAQQKQQNDDADDDDKKSNQQQDKKQAAQENDDDDDGDKKQAGKVPPQFLENIKKKKEESKDKDKKEAAQQKQENDDDEDDKKSNQQQQKKEANEQVQALQQQLQAMQQQLQNMMEQQQMGNQQQVQQNQQPQVQQNQQPQVQQNQMQQPQMVQQNDDDAQLLDQMLAQEMQQQPMLAGEQQDIQIEGAQMDVGETQLGPEDDVLTALFASSPEVQQAQAALALTTGIPYQPAAPPQVRQASQGFVRTASTRTVGTHPTGGVSQLGGGAAPAGEAGGGEIDKLSNLWNSAPDVSQVFNPTY
jgi:hypothetical protein